ncbi:Ig-like domain-containing protein [Spirosomataceae bacterium TFI 002]|nr:Ig-like domain-containing protein [Spirosomataceae bacterium TFI 002]
MFKNYSILLTISLYIIISSCAQFVPPTGGPKDITPPNLTESFPKNETLNYKQKTIRLVFDELIDASSLRQELIITPQPESAFEVKVKSNELLLQYDKPFLDSTTYTFNFRQGIKDLNERTPAKNLKLVFSTGNEIDSLSISGKANYLWSGQIADEVLVGLYTINKEDTIPVLLRKPNYFIKTDTSGNYSFENIKSGKYQLIAFQDKNSNLIFDQSKELFSFHPDTIKLDSNISNLTLSLYPNDRTELKVKRSLARRNNYSIAFNKDYEKIEVNFPTDDSLTYQFRREELLFFKHPNTSDTTLTKIIVQDSLGQKLEINTKIYFQEDPETKTKIEALSIRSEIKPNIKLKKPIEYIFDFEYPIIDFDTSKFKILGDTTYLEKYTFEWLDPSHTKISIKTNPIAKRDLQLNFQSGAITNYKSDTNSTYTLINTLYPQESYGLIEGTINKDSSNYIIQLIDSKTTQVIDFQETNSIFSFKKVIAGNYYLRIIKDANNNHRWDTGYFEQQQQPEEITIYPELLRLKENFELRDIVIN